MKHPNEETLNDYVDELLPDDRTQEVRRHLGECEECSRAVGELSELIARASRLGEIEPSRDLLPEIRKATRRPGFGWTRWVAAAAVVAFVGLLAVLQIGNGEATGDLAAGSEPSIESLIEDFRAAEAAYVRATAELAQRLEERRDELEPELLAVLDRNLAQIDDAIAEVRQALSPDGPDVRNHQMLTALYDKKLQILWRASRLSS
ncbi:MAG: hypothetical protein GTO30_08640 [Acidobacteria bacterium]|nr:hypothetical protein [Acidobacteriota bacterium]NIM61705.1 hypothetical protein [Acidobacteriota bacterium]NIO58187.1 hypothetical protein [Acidobacteriota bacterium]NIQ83752.1 hypothetical protein [Acidobacteriota bacterium]NIT09915.1 hypothetical protein [Acidobacteriota bacterium]